MSELSPGVEARISIEHVSKIFGPEPGSVLDRMRAGASKAEVMEETGHVIGLRDVSLRVRPGETFVVMGLSGSGKSTLIRHVNRLIEPTAGRILVDGEDVLALGADALRDLRRHKMSMVFQRFALLPHKTVLENVAYGLEIAGVARRRAAEQAARQLELVGLEGFERQYPRQLSGGMQQRVGLARALATDAEILLMDEAFSALDPLIRNDMQEQLRELQGRLHKTIMFITHDLDEALRLGDHVAILKDGELRQVGTPEEILLHPADDYVTRFVRDVNRGRVVTMRSIAARVPTIASRDASRQALTAMLGESGEDGAAVFVLDGERPVGAITAADLDGAAGRGEEWWHRPENLPRPVTVAADQVIEDVMPQLSRSTRPLAIVDDDGCFIGTVSRKTVVEALAQGDHEPRTTSPHAG